MMHLTELRGPLSIETLSLSLGVQPSDTVQLGISLRGRSLPAQDDRPAALSNRLHLLRGKSEMSTRNKERMMKFFRMEIEFQQVSGLKKLNVENFVGTMLN
jgi:hypothetical protein